jgi:hypothetical protein
MALAVLAGGSVMMPAGAEAASLSKADKVALKQAIVACKAEAKGKKIKWLARRKYVNNCVTEALKDHPNMDITQMLKKRPDITNLPEEKWDEF